MQVEGTTTIARKKNAPASAQVLAIFAEVTEILVKRILAPELLHHLIEALLFSSSVNIGAEWEDRDFTEMIELAKELKHACKDDVELSKICFYEEQNYEDNWSKDLIKNFKKLIKTLNLEKA
jgi:hypothetical protein